MGALVQPLETTLTEHTQTVTSHKGFPILSRYLSRCAASTCISSEVQAAEPGAITNASETGTENGCQLHTLAQTRSTTKMHRVGATRETRGSYGQGCFTRDARTRRRRLKLTSNTHLALEPLSETKRKGEAPAPVFPSWCEHGRFYRSVVSFVSAEPCVHKHGHQHVGPIGRKL